MEEEARNIFAGTAVNITVEGQRHLGAVVGIKKTTKKFDIVEEARRDNPVEAFNERGVRKYKHYLKFCVLKNRCLFVTKETSKIKPLSPSKRPWDISGYKMVGYHASSIKNRKSSTHFFFNDTQG